MEARNAFDRLLTAEDAPAAARESEEAKVVRQNREAVASWAGLGVPVPVIH